MQSALDSSMLLWLFTLTCLLLHPTLERGGALLIPGPFELSQTSSFVLISRSSCLLLQNCVLHALVLTSMINERKWHL